MVAFRGERIINLRSGGVPKRSRAVTSNPRGSRSCFGGFVANYPGKLSAANFNVIKHTDKHRTLLLISRPAPCRRCHSVVPWLPWLRAADAETEHSSSTRQRGVNNFVHQPLCRPLFVILKPKKGSHPVCACVYVCGCMFKTIPGAAGFFISNVFAAFTR